MTVAYVHTYQADQWVFGLQWQPVLRSLTTTQRRRLAKQAQATAYIEVSKGWRCLGLAAIAIKKQKNYAAAVAYALAEPSGVQLKLFALADTCFWLVAAQDGLPLTQGDVLFSHESQAKEALQQLADTHQLNVDLTIYPIEHFFSLVKKVNKAALVLQPLRHWQKKWGLLSFTALFMGAYFWSVQTQGGEVAPKESSIDLYQQEWQQASQRLVGMEALMQLYQQLLLVPVEIAGWQLQKAECEAKQEQWHCIYDYKATNQQANAAQFESVIKPQWHLEERGFDALRIQQQLPIQLGLVPLLSPQDLRSQLLGALQQRRPLFQQLRLAQPQLWPSRAVAQSGTHPVYQRELHIKAPLRVLTELSQLADVVNWRQVVLSYNAQTTAETLVSRLQLQLSGVVYVHNTDN